MTLKKEPAILLARFLMHKAVPLPKTLVIWPSMDTMTYPNSNWLREGTRSSLNRDPTTCVDESPFLQGFWSFGPPVTNNGKNHHCSPQTINGATTRLHSAATFITLMFMRPLKYF